jgi:hypothetical protein
MKTPMKSLGLLCTMASWLAVAPVQAQLNQLTVGAVSTNLNSKLMFANGVAYDVSSGYTQPLIYTLVSNLVQLRGVISDIKGYYNTTNFALYALSSTNTKSAAPGSYIVCEIVSVTGPTNATFAFWEQGAKEPTYSYRTGAPTGSNRFDVTDIASGGGLPYGDPIGAIPGRRFTADKPGEYMVGFKLYDTSANSLTMGPVHAPSDVLTVKFKTAVETAITRIAMTNSVATLTLNQGGLTNLFVEASPGVTPPAWTTLAGPFPNAPIGGNTSTLRVTNAATMPSRYFRLRGTGPQ